MPSISHSLRRPRSLAIALLAGAALLVLGSVPSARAVTTAPTHIVVTVSPKTPAVGQPITITAVLKDASNNTVSASGAGFWSDSGGDFRPSAFAQFVNGVASVTVPFDKPVHNDVITVLWPGITGTSRAFNVLGPLDHLTTSIPSGLRVGTPFNVTLTARDAANNPLTGYTGAVSWSDAAGKLPAPNGFTGGVSKTSVQLADPVRADRLTITTGGLSVTRSLSVVGPVTKLDLRAPSSVTPGNAFQILAYARDAAGNVVPDYNAPASWIDSAGALNPPAPAAFIKGVSNSIAQFPVPVKADVVTLQSGQWSAHRSITAVGPLDHIAVAWTTAGADPNCNSITGSLVARAVDAAGNLLTSYNDSRPGWAIVNVGTYPFFTPTSPAPFVAGVSNNPNVTITQYLTSTVTVSVTTGGASGAVTVCGG